MQVYIIYTLLVILAAFAQSTLGFGFVVITMTAFPSFFGYGKSLGLNLAICALSTFLIAFKLRKNIKWKAMIPILIPTMIILTITTLLTANVSSKAMSIALGIMLLGISIYFFVFSSKIHLNPTPRNAVFMGLLCGLFYGLFGIGGPTAALYLMPSVDTNEEYLATIQGYLCINNILSVILRIILGTLVFTDMPLIGLGWGAMLIGNAIGLWVFKKIPIEAFRKIVYAFVGVNGIWMLVSNIFM